MSQYQCMFPRIFWLAIILALVVTTDASIVTLFRAQRPDDLPTVKLEREAATFISPIGPAAETGVTLYEIKEVESRVLCHFTWPTITWATETLVSPPTTTTDTMELGASIHHENHEPYITRPLQQRYEFPGIKETCSLDKDKNEGVCVDVIRIPVVGDIFTGGVVPSVLPTWTVTQTMTFTGPPIPFANVTFTDGVANEASGRRPNIGALAGMITVVFFASFA
ncbi:hypothetical protein BJ165DRAFT_189809 [Panaeolus papilionaceus]|nr:hypothetical protein BJ165DRAFT_189809 [Panaeolus papilionaceus]